MKTKQELEAEVLAMLAQKCVYLNAWTQLSHWLAAKRLQSRGIIRESVVCNVFELA